MSVNRRTLVRTGAWSVPVVAMAAAAPAMAVSGGPPVVDGVALAGKCPGQSTDAEWTTVVTVQLSGPADMFVVPTLSLNDKVYSNPCTMPVNADKTVWYVVLSDETNSANASGTGTFSYTTSLNGHNYSGTGNIAYDGTHPLPKEVCQTASAGCGA